MGAGNQTRKRLDAKCFSPLPPVCRPPYRRPMTHDAILDFWFAEHGPDDWFSGSAAFDAEVTARFSETLACAAACELWAWRDTPDGRLAEIIVLDQFSRQIHRGSPQAFATDPLSLALAQEAVRAGDDLKISADRRMFLYMPFMHSESLVVHADAMRLFSSLGSDGALKAEQGHVETLTRFGRYPKRNAVLGRASTPEEDDYITESGNRMF